MGVSGFVWRVLVLICRLCQFCVRLGALGKVRRHACIVGAAARGLLVGLASLIAVAWLANIMPVNPLAARLRAAA